MERSILHCDLNNFYASVECVLNPQLRGKPVAVCGSVEERHGIVLAKSQAAKIMGIKTGEAVWQAKSKCPDLIIVPPNFYAYAHYSRVVKEIYSRYTDYVEPFGLDECWLDITGSKIYGKPYEIAHKIKEAVKEETGLTISVGLSFNKIFAKLGSDMKKPDAITVIPKDSYREKIWHLPASDLLGVGWSTTKKLSMFGVNTIGDLAKIDPRILTRVFGKNGMSLWLYANGQDTSRVRHQSVVVPLKSIGHGITCRADLENPEEVWKVIFELSQDVATRLRENHAKAGKIQLSVKNAILHTNEFQTTLSYSTRSSYELATEAMKLFQKNYNWIYGVRALTVRAIGLISDDTSDQLSFFQDNKQHEKYEQVEIAVEKIRSSFGKRAVTYASLMSNDKMPQNTSPDVAVLPSPMYK